MVWSQNSDITAINYSLVLDSRPICVLHANLYHHHNFDVIVQLRRDFLVPRMISSFHVRFPRSTYDFLVPRTISSLHIRFPRSMYNIELDPSSPPPNQLKASDLKRDDRIRVATLRDEGYTYEHISQRLGYNPRQV